MTSGTKRYVVGIGYNAWSNLKYIKTCLTIVIQLEITSITLKNFTSLLAMRNYFTYFSKATDLVNSATSCRFLVTYSLLFLSYIWTSASCCRLVNSSSVHKVMNPIWIVAGCSLCCSPAIFGQSWRWTLSDTPQSTSKAFFKHRYGLWEEAKVSGQNRHIFK